MCDGVPSEERGAIDRDVFIHDLKNVMTGALGHLSLVRHRVEKGRPVQESLDTVEGILRGACRMAEEALRSKASGGLRELSVVDTVCACAGICVPPEGVDLRIRYGRNLPMVRADIVKMRQLFNNLLTNAVHAIDGAGRIEIAMDREMPDRRASDPRVVRVTVTDSGPGIAPALRERIFERGYSTREDGAGVGLFSAREWLRSIGGEVFCEAPPSGTGGRLVVRLPGAETDDPRTVPLEPAAAGAAGRVLVLEDDEMVRGILGEMLDHLGCEMIATVDGRETVRLFKEAMQAGDPFRLAILDLNVPGGLGGVETAERIRKINPDIPLFISSGQEAGAVMNDPKGQGFAGRLKKPYSLEELAAILN